MGGEGEGGESMWPIRGKFYLDMDGPNKVLCTRWHLNIISHGMGDPLRTGRGSTF
jgi:hypothetical protein